MGRGVCGYCIRCSGGETCGRYRFRHITHKFPHLHAPLYSISISRHTSTACERYDDPHPTAALFEPICKVANSPSFRLYDGRQLGSVEPWKAKITVALSSLQRLIALRPISLSAILAIIQINDCTSQGVHIRLKILQTLPSLIINFSTIHSRVDYSKTYVLSLCAPSLLH